MGKRWDGLLVWLYSTVWSRVPRVFMYSAHSYQGEICIAMLYIIYIYFETFEK